MMTKYMYDEHMNTLKHDLSIKYHKNGFNISLKWKSGGPLIYIHE